MVLIAFPITWDYRRVCEILVACYSSVVGAVFMLVPSALSNPGYRLLGNSGLAWEIGLVLMLVSLGHAWALWLNGSNPPVSKLIRKIACFAHLSVIGLFAWAFLIGGLYWGCVSMALIMVMIYLALTRVYETAPTKGGDSRND